MTTNNINGKLKEAATVWQLIFGIGSTIVFATAFVFSVKSDVSSNSKDILRSEKSIQIIEEKQLRFEEKTEVRQKEILDKLNDIQLQIKDKQDRK